MKKIITLFCLVFSVTLLSAQTHPGEYTIKNLDINTKNSDFGTAFLGKGKVIFAAPTEDVKVIRNTWKENAKPNIYKTKSKNAQEAHEAIRPTHVENKIEGINSDQQKLYRLIWERAVSSQMKEARLLKTKIIANIEKEEIPDFRINGSRVLYEGWLMVDRGAKGDDTNLPEVIIGEKLNLIDLDSKEKETQPKGRYTEAGLVKELESRGIGRPSTYASIIKTIIDRGYVNKEGKTLFPTDTGDVVSSFLEDNFTNYISDTFTAEMENKLDDIANGKGEYKKTLKDFYGPFQKEIKIKEKIEKITNMGDAPDDILCPKCKAKMIIKLSRNGKFYSCSLFPDCVGARTMEGKKLEGPKETGEICPDCGEKKGGKLVTREGKYGSFVSCSRYPKCKFIKEDEEEKKRKTTNVSCPICKKGLMMERRGRFGIFYSCSNYPKCKYAIKAKPTGELCFLCQSLMMEGTKTIPERCSDRMCRNHNPHKTGENLKNNKK